MSELILSLQVQKLTQQIDSLTKAVAAPGVSVRTVTPAKVSEITGIPIRVIQAAINRGDLPSIKVGERTPVVRVADIDTWLDWLEHQGDER